MESTCAFSLSVRPSIACISSNLFMYFRWSSRILQSELFMMLSLTIGDWIMSSTSWVTTMASPKNFRTVLKRYLIYSAATINHYYVGATRARTQLFVLCNNRPALLNFFYEKQLPKLDTDLPF